MEGLYDSDKRKLLSSLSHASIFLSSLVISIGIPIAILFVTEDPVVKENAKEAINFHFNVWLYSLLLIPISFLTFGLANGVWFLVHCGLSAWAIVQCLSVPEQSFRYPFIFRLL